MTAKGGEERALEQLVREAREQERPELDWNHVEQSLCERLHQQPRPVARRRWSVGLMAAAVAAAAAFVLSRPSPQLESHTPPRPTQARDAVYRAPSSRTAEVGDVLTAEASAVAFEQAGLARWEIEPHGRVRVLETGQRVALELEHGAVRARVVPSPGVESFAIIVGDTRVAVHGTVFRVERRNQEAWVEVREGAVSVGRATGEDHRRILLQGPTSERFTLDGRRVADARPARDQPAAPAAAAPALGTAATASQVHLPDAPSIDDIERGVEFVVASLRACFTEHTPQSGNVQILARTTVSFTVTPSGDIRDLAFAPPLAPAVQQCGEQHMRQLRFPASSRGAPVTRSIELRR